MGIICVLKSSTGQAYTYSVSAENATIIGYGDIHDTRYEHMQVDVNGSLMLTNKHLGVEDNLVTYSI